MKKKLMSVILTMLMLITSTQWVMAEETAVTNEILSFGFNNEITGEVPTGVTLKGSGEMTVSELPSKMDKSVFLKSTASGTTAGARFDFDAVTEKVTLIARMKSSSNSQIRVYSGDDSTNAIILSLKGGYTYRNEAGGATTAISARTDNWCWVEMVIDPAEKKHTVKFTSETASASMSEAKEFTFRNNVSATDIGAVEFQDISGNGIYVDNVYMIKGTGERVEGIEWTEEDILNLEIGDTHQSGASVMPEGAICDKIFYTSSNSDVVKVSEDGLLTALKNGRAKVTATTMDGAFSKEVLVLAGDGEIAIDDTSVKCIVDDEFLTEDELSDYTVDETEGKATVSIVPIPYETDSSVKITNSGEGEQAGIVKDFDSIKGIVTVETRVMRDALVDGQAVCPYIMDSNGNPLASILIDGRYLMRYSGQTMGVLKNNTGIAQNFWYNIKVVLDTVNGIYDVYVDDRLCESNISFRNDGTDVASVRFSIAGANSGTVYVDYLKVYGIEDDEEVTFGPISNEDFSGETAEGWTFSTCQDTENSFVGIRDEAAVISNTSTTATSEHKIKRVFDEPLTGKVVIEYDFISNKVVDNSYGNGNIALFYDSNGKQIAAWQFWNWYAALNGTGSSDWLSEKSGYSLNTWYNVKFEMDLDEQKYYITYKKRDTGEVILDKKEVRMRAGSTSLDLARYEATFTATRKVDFVLDNFKVSAPDTELLAARLEDGTNLRNLSNVKYNIKSLNVEFKNAMDVTSLENSIMIKNMKTGKPIAYSGMLDESGKIYTLTLCEEVFEKDTKYILVVPETCKTASGTGLKNPENITFFTEKDNIKVEVLKFINKETKEDLNGHYGELTTFNAFTQISNYDTEYSNANLILAVYDSMGKMVSCKSVEKGLSEYGDVVEIEHSVTIPEGDGNYKVKAYIWYGKENMKPVIDSVSIGK